MPSARSGHDGQVTDSLPQSTPDESADPALLFARLAQIVYAADDFDEIYQNVCDAAPLLVAGCDHASLTLLQNGRVITVAATDDIAQRIDGIENEVGEGPCIDAIVDEAAYIDADLTTGSPWPRLASRLLAETPVRGAAGFRLLVDGQKHGALNLFSDTPGRLSPKSVNDSIVLAAFTSVALIAAAHKQSALTLQKGLESNREIGKAIGLIMAFHKISDVAAFEMLRKASQDMNLKLSAVAHEIITHHNSRRQPPPQAPSLP